MGDATAAFQRLLTSKGMPQVIAEHFIVCALEAQDKTLLSLVYRRPGGQSIETISQRPGTATTLRPQDPGWNEPQHFDVNGLPIDDVVDWTAVESGIVKQDKAVGMLMVLAAQSVLVGVRTPEYWDMERRWLDGQVIDVMRVSAARGKGRVDVR
jgi:hypothetical protein